MNIISHRKEIEIGSVVKALINERLHKWEIVPEVDEGSAEYKIAGDSALGRVLLGRGEQELISHTLFDGTIVEIKILQISNR